MQVHQVNIQMRKARNGWTVEVEPFDKNGDYIEDSEGRQIDETFILPGDLDAEALGREIVASLVSMRIGEPAAKKGRK